VLRGAAQGDHQELVTRVARKGNLLAHRRVHPHHEPEGAAVVVEVAGVYQKFDAHRARASSRFSEDRNEYDRALVESWAECWSRRMSTNKQMRRSTGMAKAWVEKWSVARGQNEMEEERPSPDAGAQRAVHFACARE
jgi:hypothetical protein